MKFSIKYFFIFIIGVGYSQMSNADCKFPGGGDGYQCEMLGVVEGTNSEGIPNSANYYIRITNESKTVFDSRNGVTWILIHDPYEPKFSFQGKYGDSTMSAINITFNYRVISDSDVNDLSKHYIVIYYNPYAIKEGTTSSYYQSWKIYEPSSTFQKDMKKTCNPAGTVCLEYDATIIYSSEYYPFW